MKTQGKRLMETMGIILLTFFLSWLIPPVVQRIKHLCPVKPDGVNDAQALPMWARRYGVNCSMCHTVFPRLNKVGYMFRRAGYRWPDDIGKEVEIKSLKDFMAVRGLFWYRYEDSRQKGGAVTKKDNQLVSPEVTFYPGSGAWDKVYSSLFELSSTPAEENLETENAYIKGTWGKPDLFFTVKGGIFHAFEGYGSSDRPIGNIRPLFQQTQSNNGTQNTIFTIWNPPAFPPGGGSMDQVGLELGGSWKDSHLTLAVFNGVDGTSGTPDPLHKRAGTNTPNMEDKDLQLFFNQFIGEGAISLYYYNGVIPLTAPDPVGQSTSTWSNAIQRFAIYANYPVLKQYLDVHVGYMKGKDDRAKSNTGVGAIKDGSISQSQGFFLGLESILHPHCAVTAEYDFFDPNQDGARNGIRAATFAVVAPFENVRYTLDYRYKTTEVNGADVSDKIENRVNLEWQWLF